MSDLLLTDYFPPDGYGQSGSKTNSKKRAKSPDIRTATHDGLTIRQQNEKELNEEPDDFSFDPKTGQAIIPFKLRHKNAYSTTINAILDRGQRSKEALVCTYSTSTGWSHYELVKLEDRHYLIKKEDDGKYKLVGFVDEQFIEQILERACFELDTDSSNNASEEEIAREEAEALAKHGLKTRKKTKRKKATRKK